MENKSLYWILGIILVIGLIYFITPSLGLFATYVNINSGTGFVHVEVLDDRTNLPIDGASVSLIINQYPVSGLTDSSGWIYFENLARDTYNIEITKSGYFSQTTSCTLLLDVPQCTKNIRLISNMPQPSKPSSSSFPNLLNKFIGWLTSFTG